MSIANYRYFCLVLFTAYLLIHLSVFIFLTFSEDLRKVPSKFKWIEYYKAYLHIGPFFNESQIQHSNKFFYSLKTDNSGWKEWVNPEQINFENYHKSKGWQISSLRLSWLEKSLANKIYLEVAQSPLSSKAIIRNELSDDTNVQVMHYYLNDRYWTDSNIDSARFLMLKFTPLSNGGQGIDSLFCLTYSYHE